MAIERAWYASERARHAFAHAMHVAMRARDARAPSRQVRSHASHGAGARGAGAFDCSACECPCSSCADAALALLLALSRPAAPAIALPHHTPLRFIVTGDAGATHSTLRDGMLAVTRRMHVDGILLVGDNFYPCGVSGLADPQWTKITA